ncbi:MAG: DegQ family serine endoprotease [Candidatus Scalindua rubra]|uniref:Probable periplasmic serine endoprotease DegP-like n=1 Tax=Candidatus Scalindua brodae TaxID=237368 RepID=A0A0B0EN99_9BACT|nr:MAG: serine proteinase HtrA/DegQ/DegS family protein [Candidatus Scalindua brodae]MBZ0109396.1 DegQ family serine endoprotease [Candidatus Scalindua rubra]TWU34815.1 putative periplasmic serine endoprotease DegP-like precursor [Candidatus Brocadiaceae bacterium S225]
MKTNSMLRLLLLSFLSIFIALPAHAIEDSGVKNLRQTGKAFAAVAREVSPSVVFIQVEAKASGRAITGFQLPFGNEWPFEDDLFKRFFGDKFPGIPREPRSDKPRHENRAIGQGSGFVCSVKDGFLSEKTYILTNNHVVENADKIRVQFQDGSEYEAKITGCDPQSDVAVIEIKNSNKPTVKLGDSSELEVGEWVVAIGNPFGLNHTLTVGVVSAKGRTSIGINDYEDFIQTDAAINPGNSGGPLVNLDGEVVGINTAIFSRSGGYMGVGFAIPINLARDIANQLIDTGEVTRGYLGIMIQPLTADLAKSFGADQGKGILISQVTDDSPAEKAGLKQGDVIVAYRGEPVTDVGTFRNKVALTRPGSREELTILRDGKQKTLNVTIGKLTEDKLIAPSPAQSAENLGLTVQTLTPELAEQFDAKEGNGVVITEVKPDSIAAMAGINTGTVIVQVDRKPVKNAAEFKRAVEKSSGDRSVLLLLKRGNISQYVALSW